jgi:hypothetical protein
MESSTFASRDRSETRCLPCGDIQYGLVRINEVERANHGGPRDGVATIPQPFTSRVWVLSVLPVDQAHATRSFDHYI